MKKVTSSGSPSKWAAVATSAKIPSTLSLTSRHERVHINSADNEQDQVHLKIFEDELMGHKEGEGQIGDSIERNMNQMVEVLRSKINAMGNAAKTRIRLCEEDLKKNSKESSDQAPKMMEDFDESANAKGTREIKNGFISHKDNLVSAEGVHIDALHLVIRTKAPTDAAKKLELEIEESFTSANLRGDTKKMRGKTGMSRTEKSKKSEQKRFEAKKVLRNKSEKDLQTNMENFLTRSVMDADLTFRAPTLPSIQGALSTRKSALHHTMMKTLKHAGVDSYLDNRDDDEYDDSRGGVGRAHDGDMHEDRERRDGFHGDGDYDYMDVFEEEIKILDPVTWPIAIKWPLKDPRSAHPDNGEGEMDPTLLLRYSVEKINLPSGENMFRWLVRQSTVQQYFVCLFWLIKVKFFEKDSDPENESFLLRGLSVEYVKIMDLLASHGHGAEYEKDFAYQYLPYILSNAVYFGFFFLCPGSRHIYTKSFKKTILLQVVKVMHGLQLCTASVKVLWVRLFPEDNHDADDDLDDATEIFPVQIAIGNDSKYTTKNLLRNANDMNSHTGGGGVRVGSAIRNEVERREEDSLTRLDSADYGSLRKTFSSSSARTNVPKPRRESMPDIPYRGEVASERGEDHHVNGTDRRQRGGRGLASTHTHAFTNTSMSLRSKSQSRSKSPDQRIKITAKTQGFVTKRKSVDSDTGQIVSAPSLIVSEKPLRVVSERGTDPGPSSLQNLMRNSSHLTDIKKSQSNRFLGSDTMPLSSTSSKLKGSRFQAPAGIPSLSTILNLPPNPPVMSSKDIGASNTGNGTLLSGRAKGGIRTSSRGIPVVGMASSGTGQNSIKTLGVGPADDISTPSWAFNVRPGTGTRSGTETWVGSTTESGIGEALNLHEDEGNPLERTLLKSTSLRHGHKLMKLTRRQSTETINMKSVSPLMQEYFVSSVMAPVRTGIGAQLMHRTVPVSWCTTGGADTHRKRVIFTDLHQDITDKGKEVDKEFLLASYLGKKNILDNLKLINSSCAAVLRSDAATIGRFSLDLVKRQQQMRKGRGAGGRGEFIPELPIEAPSADLLSVSDATLAANFDPVDLDNFLANI